MHRRQFLRRGIAGVGAGVVVPSISMLHARAQVAPTAPGISPYGPLSETPDDNGLLLPEGFSSRVIAVAGEPVGDTGYAWHAYPDGTATFDDGEGGWYYVCNSEVFDFLVPESGGASAIHFGPDGEILDAYRILEGSNSNCAGGPTPWGTWLSCEENFGETGRVFECDPTGVKPAVVHEALGRWAHEAVAVDPDDEILYLTQDHPEGLLYRFSPNAYPDLSAGVLEACIVVFGGAVTWGPVVDPSGVSAPTRTQVPGATVFTGNEGIWYHEGWIYFTTKYDHSVHGIDLRAQIYQLIWKGDPEGLGVEGAVLSGVDNITVDAGTGDLVVAEDGGNMELVIITPEGVLAPLVRVMGQDGSEVTGPVFNPTRDRLYFSSQRAPALKPLREIVPGLDSDDLTAGVTYEITGPFRGRVEPPPPPTTTTTAPATTTTTTATTTTTTVPSPITTLTAARDAAAAASSDDDGDDGSSAAPIAIAGVIVVAAVGGAIALRRRKQGPDDASPDGLDG